MSLISNYPGGFANGVSIQGLPVLNTYGGNVYWVSSTRGSDGNKGTRERPFATLDYAIGRCTADNGDIIMVMPKHAETITGAGGITADVAGISIIGMGTYSQRPRFLMDGSAAVTFVISAADVTVQNMVFAAGDADVVTCFNVTAVGATLQGLEFVQNTTDENFLTEIKATGAANSADGLKVVGCRAIGLDAAAVEFVEITDNISGLVIADNLIIKSGGTAAPIFLQAGSKVASNIAILRNFLQNANTANDLAFDNGGSGNSGIIAYNNIGHADVTGSHALGAVAGCRFFENRSVSTDALSGLLLPAADVDL